MEWGKSQQKTTVKGQFLVRNLDETEQRVFRTDAANDFSLSGVQLAKLLGLEASYIRGMRARPHYRYAVQRYNQEALDVLLEAQNEGIRTLQKLLKDDQDPRVRLLAAQELIRPTQEYAIAKAKAKALSEAVNGANGEAQAIAAAQGGVTVFETEWGASYEPAQSQGLTDESEKNP